MTKKTQITQEEYQKVEEQSLAAKELLEDPRFEFLRTYIQNSITSAEQTILNNTLREVQEVVPISEKVTRIFKTPKKVQVDELAGQYKWVKQFQDDLKYFASQQEELDAGIESGVVKFEGGVGKDVSG